MAAIVLLLLEKLPAAVDIIHNGRDAILYLGHSGDQRYHIAGSAGVDNLIGCDARSLRHEAYIPLGEVLRWWRIAVEHLAYGAETIAARVGIKEYEHSAIAIRHTLKLLKLAVPARQSLATIACGGATYIAWVTVS